MADQPAPAGHWTTPGERRPLSRWIALVGLLPIAFAAMLSWVSPAFLEPLGDLSVVVGGLPIAAVMVGIVVALTLAGLGIMLVLRSWLGVFIGLAVGTLPASFIVMIGPAIVLIARNVTP